MVVGTTTGLLSIRERQKREESDAAIADPTISSMASSLPQNDVNGGEKRGTYRYFIRGTKKAPSNDDFVVMPEARKHKEPDYVKHLRSFKYSRVLDSLFERQHNPDLVVAVLEELIHRGDAIHTALSGRNDAALEPILWFSQKYCVVPEYSAVILNIVNVILGVSRCFYC